MDFAPTMLALAGAKVPTNYPGRIFLGPQTAPERKYIFAARDRMDEAPDRIRAVRSRDFKYIRNFRSELPYAQRIDYMELMPTMRVWRQINYDGKLNATQRLFFSTTKPAEELYDMNADPHEIRNLAAEAKFVPVLGEMRAALEKWIVETGDLCAVPETELICCGLVADKLPEYNARVQPLEIPLTGAP